MPQQTTVVRSSTVNRGTSGLLAMTMVATLALLGCAPPPREHHTFYRMDTVVEVTLVMDKGTPPAASTWAQVDALLKTWEQQFSQTNPRSEILAVNQHKGKAAAISSQLADMIDFGLRYGDSTRGTFDITTLPLKELWGLGEGDTIHKMPSSELLRRALSRVNYRWVHLSAARDSVLFDSAGVVIDVGGVAKGFALTAAGRMLDSLGYHSYLIVCGDVICRGRRPDGKPWRIGIRHPRKDGLLATLGLDTGSVFTSGDYERFWIDSTTGTRIHHIFDPRTGRSATKNQSVTIWSPEPLRAKALSTGLFSYPADSIVAFVEARAVLECVVVDSSGAVFCSKGWKNAIAWE